MPHIQQSYPWRLWITAALGPHAFIALCCLFCCNTLILTCVMYMTCFITFLLYRRTTRPLRDLHGVNNSNSSTLRWVTALACEAGYLLHVSLSGSLLCAVYHFDYYRYYRMPHKSLTVWLLPSLAGALVFMCAYLALVAYYSFTITTSHIVKSSSTNSSQRSSLHSSSEYVPICHRCRLLHATLLYGPECFTPKARHSVSKQRLRENEARSDDTSDSVDKDASVVEVSALPSPPIHRHVPALQRGLCKMTYVVALLAWCSTLCALCYFAWSFRGVLEKATGNIMQQLPRLAQQINGRGYENMKVEGVSNSVWYAIFFYVSRIQRHTLVLPSSMVLLDLAWQRMAFLYSQIALPLITLRVVYRILSYCCYYCFGGVLPQLHHGRRKRVSCAL